MTMSNQRAIALAGLFTSLHVIILMIMNVIPGTELLVLFGLPVIAALYYQMTSTRHAFIFAFATALLVLLIDPIRAVIWIIPSLVIGISYGLLIRLKWKALAIVYGLSFIHALVLFASLAIGGAMLGVDFWSKLQTEFFHWDVIDAWIFGPLMLWFYGLSQSVITHVIASKELTRLGVKIEQESEFPIWSSVLLVLSHLLGIVLSLTPVPPALPVWLASQVVTLSIALVYFTIKRRINVAVYIASAFLSLLLLVLALTVNSTFPSLILFSLTNFSLLPLVFYMISLYAHPKSE